MAKAPESTSAPEALVKIMLMCDHVFLPEDLTRDDWSTSAETKRYQGKDGKSRTRLDVHPTLAAFLQEREQAEVI